MWLDGALCWCYSNSCQSTPEQKYFLLEYQFSQVAWLQHWFAISLSYRQTSFQARWKSVFQSPVGRSHVCLSHHKLSTSWQCFFTCSLASPVSCTGAFGQTETKPCPTANTRFMQVQRGGLSVHKCQAPAPDSICTPIHAPTAESSTNSILLVGNKGRKTLWVTEQGYITPHILVQPTTLQKTAMRQPYQAPPRGQKENSIALSHSGVLHLHPVLGKGFPLWLCSET